MNFRLIATQTATAESGTLYDHIIWIGEFDGLESTVEEALEFARTVVGFNCCISEDEIPTTLH